MRIVSRLTTRQREQGQALLEYALIAAVIAVLGIGGYSAAGGSMQSMFARISSGTAGIVQTTSTSGPTTPTTTAKTTTQRTTTAATTTTKKKKSH